MLASSGPSALRSPRTLHATRPARSGRVCGAAAASATPAEVLDSAGRAYALVTARVPPIATAAAVPVVALSLLVKALTGSGLPGPVLGGLEGVSWLLLFAGAGSLLPRVSELLAGGLTDVDAAVAVLTKPAPVGGLSNAETATARVERITASTDPRSALGLQLADLARAKRDKEAMEPAARAALVERDRELAKAAVDKARRARQPPLSPTRDR